MDQQPYSPTFLQERWIDAFADCLNATEAAVVAGYKGTRKTFNQTGWKNLSNPKLKPFIDEALQKRGVSAEWILQKLRDIASLDIADLLDAYKEQEPHAVLAKAKKLGLSKLIKKLKPTPSGLVIEFHDPVRALEILARHTITTKQEVEHSVVSGVMVIPASAGEAEWDTIAREVSEKQKELSA
ncbi:MAG: hypothetical protein DRJ65_00040 [Acidobacteria bacterium]|nr:MAG: hypothetical protein DRJ65_00040 [Acidobacteriota bacterium]